jgi:phosphoribosylformimino-5-aminoimidazole carboxamide ribonucleotide (ProFAR) isomerase
MFVVIPAIDLLENNAVRLAQGDYTHRTTYSNNAIELSKKFENSGAKRLHIVDLNGAKTGKPEHFDLISKMRKNVSMKIYDTQIGMVRENVNKREIVKTELFVLNSFLTCLIYQYREKSCHRIF